MDVAQTLPRAHRYISTGHLPEPDDVGIILAETHALHAADTDGEVSQVYPALARVDPSLFGMSVVATDGRVYEVGAAEHRFSIMSVSKPFVMALVCQAIGWEAVRSRVGANATGMAFNSVAAIEASADGRTNPMVNSGAIATSSLVPGDGPEARWQFVLEGLSRFAGRDLSVDEEVYLSASETNFRNRSIVQFLHSRGRVYCDPAEALDLYTRQCALSVTAHDLAAMGATLAHGGVNPLTHESVVDASACRYALAVMATAGMYETSGDWLCDIGLPGKSGIGGGVVAVSPGKGGFGSFSAPLDAAGNSVRGVLAARTLSERLGLDLFVSSGAD
jgi:glutaminase